jgi:hydrogenase maturation factor HypE
LAALRTTDFEELKTLFRKTAQKATEKNEKIYELLREQLPVYPV